MSLQPYQREFLDFVIATKVLRFGEFTLKSGRVSPYFFNSGLFNTGESIGKLGQFYASAIEHAKLEFDTLFGPSYKGIPLAVTTAIALSNHHSRNVPYSFNRKEAKDHGEGGIIVGAPLNGKVLIIDDVISAGTSVRESIEIIQEHSATPAAVFIAMDRQEKGQGDTSAIQEIEETYKISVNSIVTLEQLLNYLDENSEHKDTAQAIERYRSQYGC
ncbi:Orotate phosphoribosyltransferase [hydrothermal vent metagenome]|uniref:orotate phosphoribosyltransferase n=1 Tax=hydrothermal vent metagenome TaxID=652676 RepID=A0A3B1A0I4_9ZZZZ